MAPSDCSQTAHLKATPSIAAGLVLEHGARCAPLLPKRPCASSATKEQGGICTLRIEKRVSNLLPLPGDAQPLPWPWPTRRGEVWLGLRAEHSQECRRTPCVWLPKVLTKKQEVLLPPGREWQQFPRI